MAAVGPAAFAALAWGAVVLVLAVFAYLVVVLAREWGLVGGGASGDGDGA